MSILPLSVTSRHYTPDDMLRVRDMLVETHAAWDPPINWRLERWEYARYFVASMLGDPDPVASEANIRRWEDLTGVWQDASGEVVAVATIEHPDLDHEGFGEAALMRRPGHEDLLDAMLAYAERRLAHPDTGVLRVPIQDHDAALRAAAARRGYVMDPDYSEIESALVLGELPAPILPDGFVLRSMAEGGDLALRAKAFGLGFNRPDPKDWPSAATYAELQRAPDYRADLDICVVAPDGEIASFCLVWYDARNQMVSLEPVGTVPAYRRRGLARAAVLEGLHRAAALGAERAWVGSNQAFYKTLGFQERLWAHTWRKSGL